jgi:hypothetical protein
LLERFLAKFRQEPALGEGSSDAPLRTISCTDVSMSNFAAQIATAGASEPQRTN